MGRALIIYVDRQRCSSNSRAAERCSTAAPAEANPPLIGEPLVAGPKLAEPLLPIAAAPFCSPFLLL